MLNNGQLNKKKLSPMEVVNRISLKVFFLYLFLVTTAPVPSHAFSIQGTGYIRLSIESTLHDFEGRVTSYPFTIPMEKDGTGKIEVSSVEVLVPVSTITTGNPRRDREMRKMFDSEHFPQIKGRASGLFPRRIRNEIRHGEKKSTIRNISIRIRDVENSIPVTFRRLREYGEQISFEIEFIISLKEFNLEAPTAFFGLIRVNDKVRVTAGFDLEVAPSRLFQEDEAPGK